MISAIFFSLCFILLSSSLHTGPAEDIQLYPQKSFWVFLLSDKAFYPQESYVFFFFFYFNGFWRENDFSDRERQILNPL